MTITISKKLLTYLQKKEICQLIAKVSFFTEGCVLIKEPKIIAYSQDDEEKIHDSEKIDEDSLILHFTKEYRDIFGKDDLYQLDLGGTFSKKIMLKNIQPKLIRTCKMDD